MHEVKELLEDPELAELLALNAEREFVRHPDGKRNMRVYREYHQCDDFWDIQVCNPFPLLSMPTYPNNHRQRWAQEYRHWSL